MPLCHPQRLGGVFVHSPLLVSQDGDSVQNDLQPSPHVVPTLALEAIPSQNIFQVLVACFSHRQFDGKRAPSIICFFDIQLIKS